MKYTIGLLALMIFFSCNNSKTKETEKPEEENTPVQQALVFDKLVGTWQAEDGKSFERWTKNNEGYQTAGFSVKGMDTTWNEQGKVYRENEAWVFENTVNNQNEGKAVRFTSTILDGKTVQFSNPAHDFPTDINYTINNPDILNAFIVGPNEKGGKDTIPFNFTRVK